MNAYPQSSSAVMVCKNVNAGFRPPRIEVLDSSLDVADAETSLARLDRRGEKATKKPPDRAALCKVYLVRHLVRSRRLELPRVAPLPPQGSASTNSATTARGVCRLVPRPEPCRGGRTNRVNGVWQARKRVTPQIAEKPPYFHIPMAEAPPPMGISTLYKRSNANQGYRA